MTNLRLQDFFNEIESICRKYNVSISHEDGHGSFIIEDFRRDNIIWLKEARDERTVNDS